MEGGKLDMKVCLIRSLLDEERELIAELLVMLITQLKVELGLDLM